MYSSSSSKLSGDLILKEYRSSAETVVPVGVMFDSHGKESMDDDLPPQVNPFPMFIFEEGALDGEDARDVAPLAISFLYEYLSAIELECFGESYEQNVEPIKEGVTIPGL